MKFSLTFQSCRVLKWNLQLWDLSSTWMIKPSLSTSKLRKLPCDFDFMSLSQNFVNCFRIYLVDCNINIISKVPVWGAGKWNGLCGLWGYAKSWRGHGWRNHSENEPSKFPPESAGKWAYSHGKDCLASKKQLTTPLSVWFIGAFHVIVVRQWTSTGDNDESASYAVLPWNSEAGGGETCSICRC